MYFGTHYSSPVGDILIACNETALTGLWIGNQKYICTTKPSCIAENCDTPILTQARKWLDAYFSGKKPSISYLPIAPAGGEFRQQVWRILTEIPYGKTVTYGDIAKETARRMNKPKMSAQAVGGAVGHNPISIIIPCHRVVGVNGSLTGYAGGLDIKIYLLRHEGADMSGLFVPKKGSTL